MKSPLVLPREGRLSRPHPGLTNGIHTVEADLYVGLGSGRLARAQGRRRSHDRDPSYSLSAAPSGLIGRRCLRVPSLKCTAPRQELGDRRHRRGEHASLCGNAVQAVTGAAFNGRPFRPCRRERLAAPSRGSGPVQASPARRTTKMIAGSWEWCRRAFGMRPRDCRAATVSFLRP